MRQLTSLAICTLSIAFWIADRHQVNAEETEDKDLTLVTIPDAGHFVQHDAADKVTSTIVEWLGRKPWKE